MQKIPVKHIEKTTAQLSQLGNFAIRDIEEMLGENDLVQELHRHDFFYILFVSEGAGRHEIDFTGYDIAGQSLFLMRPGQVHAITLKAGSRGYLLQVGPDFFTDDQRARKMLQKAAYQNHYALDRNNSEKLGQTLAALLNEYEQRRQGFEEAVKSLLTIFVIDVLRFCEACDTPKPSDFSYAQEKLEKLMALLETNIASVKKPAAYAEMLHLTPYQLNAVTKKLLGQTASDVIHAHVILEAKRLLLSTTNQVGSIAYGLGYVDVSYFIRFFKKQTGQSPEQFRNLK